MDIPETSEPSRLVIPGIIYSRNTTAKPQMWCTNSLDEAIYLPGNFLEQEMISCNTCLIFDILILSPQQIILILDGSSEIGAQVRSTLCYLICLKQLIRYK